VLLPGQILVGLALIPYVDISPIKQGYYGWEGRKFAVSFFSFGLFLWFALIVVGQWFRGPSWEFYWPYFDYPIGGSTWTHPGVPLKVTEATLANMPNMIGLASLVIFFGGGMVAPLIYAKMPNAPMAAALNDYINKLGMIRYALIQVHVLLMLSVVGKIVIRLAFGYKYIWVTPWFNV